MKIVWHESDIVAGRTVRKPGTSETWLIGYVTEGKNKTLVSLLDGMIQEPWFTSAQLADALTDGGYWPSELIGIHHASANQGGAHGNV